MSSTPGAAFGLTDADDIDDDTPALNPATFDFAAWVAGASPVRRSVKIYARGDLLARIDELADALTIAQEAAKDAEASLDDVASVAEITEALDQARADLVASGLRVTIEGRSETALAASEKRARKAGATDKVTIWLHQLAEQIVSPAGVTADALIALREKSEPQVRKLLTAWTMANNQPPAVDAPFSPASSAPKSGRQR